MTFLRSDAYATFQAERNELYGSQIDATPIPDRAKLMILNAATGILLGQSLVQMTCSLSDQLGECRDLRLSERVVAMRAYLRMLNVLDIDYPG